MQECWQNYVGNTFVDGSSWRIDVLDPATGDRIAEHALGDAADAGRSASVVQEAVSQGARVATGGRSLNRPGAFLDHTVLDGVAQRALHARCVRVRYL